MVSVSLLRRYGCPDHVLLSLLPLAHIQPWKWYILDLFRIHTLFHSVQAWYVVMFSGKHSLLSLKLLTAFYSVWHDWPANLKSHVMTQHIVLYQWVCQCSHKQIYQFCILLCLFSNFLPSCILCTLLSSICALMDAVRFKAHTHNMTEKLDLYLTQHLS